MTLALPCLIVQNNGEPEGDVFEVQVASNDFVSDFVEGVKTKIAPNLNAIAVNRLTLWKLNPPWPLNSLIELHQRVKAAWSVGFESSLPEDITLEQLNPAWSVDEYFRATYSKSISMYLSGSLL